MLDYLLLYNMLDVYLLAEVMMELRESIWKEFRLDLCNGYLSLPMLAKDIMLLVTGAEIELMTDQEISHAFSSSIRGGHSYITTRYADVEELNRNGEKGCDVAICDLDVNNL